MPEAGWGRILDLLVILGLVFLAIGAALAYRVDVTDGLVVTIAGVLAVLVWLRLRRRREPLAAYALILLSLVGMGVDSTGAFPAILVVVAVALLGVVAGPVAALASTAVLVGLFAVSLVVTFDADLPSLLSQSAGTAALLLVGAAFGSLMRSLDQARRAAEERGAELERVNAQLRAAIDTERELALAQQRERTARELHDGLGHRLTLAGMSLQYAQRIRGEDPDRAWAEVANAAATTKDALGLMRLWVRALSPPRPVAGVGAAATFEQIAESFRGTGLEVTVEHQGTDEPLPAEVSVFSARLVQEGLTNVLRHAGATHVRLDVIDSPMSLRLGLTDNGTRASEVPEGFGLRSLRERAEELGGSLTSGPAADGGWQITATLPTRSGDPVAVGEA